MIRKTVLLAGVASALLTAAPALAQDAAPAPAAQTQGSLQLQPGANVKGSDGSVVGWSSAEFSTAPVVDDAAPATTDGTAPTAGDPLSNPTPAPAPESTPESAPQPDGMTPPTPQS